ncbi:hypothetical protein BDZ91DRAFT_678048 [Kalaharituber pfeilii]|nr:hypothetical protein BDZ91DRAFT_678048 [Kalaharituber pfeilii]
MFAFKKLLTFTLLSVAFVDARFGQETAVQNVIAAIGGNNGQAATLAGQSISTLLAGSNACDKLRLADQVAALEGAGALDAAKRLVQAEKNFNPFVVDRPSICDDVGLPATTALRGILPLIDPAVEGAAEINALSAQTLNNPLNQDGLSQADLLIEQGFTTFTAQTSGGQTNTPPVGNNNGGINDGNNNNDNNNNNNDGNNNDDNVHDGNDNNDNNNNNNNNNGQCPPANNDGGNTGGNTGGKNPTNLQSFTGNVGSDIEPITFSGNNDRPFQVAGDTFVNFAAAAARTCDRQFNRCADAANAGATGFSFEDCTTQKAACTAAQQSAPVTSFSRRARRGRRGFKRRGAKRAMKRAVKVQKA